jgi:hypothetical protein
VSDTDAVEAAAPSLKRLRRTREEKRRIVEATFVPGASIARVAREHGVNANQGIQCVDMIPITLVFNPPGTAPETCLETQAPTEHVLRKIDALVRHPLPLCRLQKVHDLL